MVNSLEKKALFKKSYSFVTCIDNGLTIHHRKLQSIYEKPHKQLEN